MLKRRHEVEILLKAGHPKTEVARLAGVVAQFELLYKQSADSSPNWSGSGG
jgi:hypothetical protein